MDANNIYGWAMSQEMPNDDFEWLSHDECREMGLLLNYADASMALFDTKLFDHRKNKKDKQSIIFEENLTY